MKTYFSITKGKQHHQHNHIITGNSRRKCKDFMTSEIFNISFHINLNIHFEVTFFSSTLTLGQTACGTRSSIKCKTLSPVKWLCNGQTTTQCVTITLVHLLEVTVTCNLCYYNMWGKCVAENCYFAELKCDTCHYTLQANTYCHYLCNSQT